jgi:hypothetical protein
MAFSMLALSALTSTILMGGAAATISRYLVFSVTSPGGCGCNTLAAVASPKQDIFAVNQRLIGPIKPVPDIQFNAIEPAAKLPKLQQ